MKYILVLRIAGLPLWLSICGGGGVHWVQVVRSCSLSLGVFRPFLPSFARFPAFLSYFAFQICLISRFKGVFGGFWGADVCLYGLRSLRGLWGFCVRERLGGFMSCGVFALLFTSSPLFFFLFAYLLGLCLCCPWLVLLAAWLLIMVLSSLYLWVVVVSFSLTDYTQKERAQSVFASSLGVLFSRLNSCDVVKKLRCRCFGSF